MLTTFYGKLIKSALLQGKGNTLVIGISERKIDSSFPNKETELHSYIIVGQD